MYQALYRKYRPKTLDDIYGQDIIVKIIKNSIQTNKINHAYLFAGPRGTGKTSIAKILAKIINCENPIDCKPCGKCRSCTQPNNSDIIEIDAASNNGVDEIRELRNKVNLLPAYGKYKVYIIDEVHMLTQGAFNALLKTLEEPPAHVIFILATTDPHKVIETILSRCQRLDFKKISDSAIVENLTKIAKNEEIKIDKGALELIAKLSDGGMRDSVGMLDQARAYTEEKITMQDIHDINGTLTDDDLSELLENIIDKKLNKILEKIDEYNEKGKNFVKLSEELIYFLRNTLLYKETPNYFKEKIENLENYQKISEKISNDNLIKYIEILNKYLFEMKNSTTSKLLFELAIIKIISNEKNEQIIENAKIPLKIEKKQSEISKIIEKPQKTETKQTNVLNDEKPKPKITTPNQNISKKLESIKQIRINNTLAKFNKKETKEITKKLGVLNEMVLNKDYSDTVSILLDGTLKAASDENLLFVYKTQRLSDMFNQNLINIEETIEKILNKKYNIIATDLMQWEILKKEFNNKLRTFEYQNENFKLKDILKNTDELENINTMFEDIIEYK